MAHGRPYTADLFGWFDDFSHTGAYDALGSFSRVQTYFNAFTVSEGLPDRLLPLPERGDAFRQIAKLRQVKRCPGASEEAAADGSQRLVRRGAGASSTASSPTGRRGRSSEARALGPGGRGRRASARSCWRARATPTGALATYEIEFDNGFGLVEGGDLKIGGVKAGQTTGFELTEREPYRVIVTAEVTEPGFERSAATPTARCASSR